MIAVFLLLLAFIPEYPAILFGGGGGCGCQPACPPPPPCPQLTLPCPPPPPCFCPPPLPPPPCPCLPCPPQPCCKRKKRSSMAAITAENRTSGETLCNNKQIRKIIFKVCYL
ncbi:unnamed protein product [Gongylonema pulchrum]|uniref:IGFBP N-terminal domain-containing protein n=1 Tax=Gongylonema pulchrum TaxID=637853 RepID=A0A183D4Z5_9BILA|nr:unnamed protein product [Gongylonema pulchrum]